VVLLKPTLPSLTFGLIVGLVALAATTEGISQDVKPSPPSDRILVFAYRAPSHVKYGKLQDFTSIVDDLVTFLNSNGTAVVNDAIQKPIISGEALPKETLATYLRDAGVQRVLYVTMERPVTINFKVNLHCYDAHGELLWEAVVKENTLRGSTAVAQAIELLHTQLRGRMALGVNVANNPVSAPVTATITSPPNSSLSPPTPALSSAANASMSDAEVRAAIDNALHGKRHDIGLALNDLQKSTFSSLGCETCGVSGYTIFVYTPEQWIELLAVQAAKEMVPFGLESITPDMRQRYLHVVAMPSTANYINASGLSAASSVHRVVLVNTDRTETVQPLQVTPGTVQSNSALRAIEYTKADTVFAMSDVDRLRAEDKNGELFIVVVGDNQNKFFKVKSRMFKQLFGSR
jgi:hypothetical protein